MSYPTYTLSQIQIQMAMLMQEKGVAELILAHYDIAGRRLNRRVGLGRSHWELECLIPFYTITNTNGNANAGGGRRSYLSSL